MLEEPQGRMPSGTMTISFNGSLQCSGTQSTGVIIVHYQIPVDVQKPYHDNPGTPHSGAYRTAYLPDNDAGRKLLARLEYAFSHGLTFTVGTSLTTGQPNCVTWSSIHHKTSLGGGVHGYPDPNYFDNCNAELDALGVPKA
jgi:deltex-like protein